MSLPSCTVLTQTEPTPIFCSSSKSGDWWHHTAAFLQLSLALSFFSGTESHAFNSDHKHMAGNELQAFHHWGHKESFNDYSKSVAEITDQYDIANLTLGVKPSSCVGDNQHVHTQIPETSLGMSPFHRESYLPLWVPFMPVEPALHTYTDTAI